MEEEDLIKEVRIITKDKIMVKVREVQISKLKNVGISICMVNASMVISAPMLMEMMISDHPMEEECQKPTQGWECRNPEGCQCLDLI